MVATSSSPITQISEDSSPITQVSPAPAPSQSQYYTPGRHAYPSKLVLDLRGTRFDLNRDTLISLPESILIVMFPNGLILRPQSNDDDMDEDMEEQVIQVDFDPVCLQYILEFYRQAQRATPSSPSESSAAAAQQPLSLGSIMPQNPLMNKQAIIVLREELDYFAIPPSSKGSSNTKAKDTLFTTSASPATQCGRILLEDRKIFTALQRNIDKEDNQAEQHLMDMLCVSGFQRDGEWGYRCLEPKRTTVVSVAMSGSNTQNGIPGTGQTIQEQNQIQMAIAQKLLLFWRKPAVCLQSTDFFFLIR
ncbi:hypothetical protein EDD21DRAFT_329548 [Dissophora ornata]|nr:hypothetical protein EDD21DRAFT_329548 [Dissophora ornata]